MLNKEKEKSGFFSLTLFSVFEKIVAFLYQATIAAVLGAGIVTDCYSSASQLYDLIDSTVLTALVVVSMRKYSEISNSSSENEGLKFLSNIKTCVLLIMFVISVIILIFANPISYFIAPGFSQSSRGKLITSIRVMSVIPMILSTASVTQSLLRQKKSFLVANSRSLCISVIGIVFLLAFRKFSLYTPIYLCIGYIASNLVFAFVLKIRSVKFGKVGFVKPKFDSQVKSLVKLAIPTIISSGILRLSLMIDQIIASMSGDGAITYLNYSQQLYHIITGLLIVNLGVVLLTDFMTMVVKEQFDAMIIKIKNAISSILLLLIPITIVTALFSNEIVSIVYQRGAFGNEATVQVAGLLKFYALSFIPLLFNTIFTQILYSFGKNKQSMVTTVISMVLNIILSLTLTRLVGLIGVAIGTSIAQILIIPLFRRQIIKCIPNYKTSIEKKYLLKVFCAMVPGICLMVLIKLFVHNALITFATATVVMFLSFYAVLFLLKEEHFCEYFEKGTAIIKRIIKR